MKNKIFKLISDSNTLGLISRLVRDETYLRIAYRLKLGKKLNLYNPKTFNEKLQWLKLNDRNSLYTILADKYEVKKYVAKKIGKEYVIPTLGIYDDFDEIDFDELPGQFVIKCTHDSGGLIICSDKDNLDKELVRKKIDKHLKSNFYYRGREWPYKNIKPRIIIEKYITGDNSGELRDYKFFVFNGKVEYFKVDFGRFIEHRANYYSRDMKLLKFGEEVCPPDFDKKIILPKNIDEMIVVSEKLSNKSRFVRVDLYNVNGKIYFGEMTFYPSSGFGKFIPNEWDKKLGNLINLREIDGEHDDKK